MLKAVSGGLTDGAKYALPDPGVGRVFHVTIHHNAVSVRVSRPGFQEGVSARSAATPIGADANTLAATAQSLAVSILRGEELGRQVADLVGARTVYVGEL